jgi:hypothetical protein
MGNAAGIANRSCSPRSHFLSTVFIDPRVSALNFLPVGPLDRDLYIQTLTLPTLSTLKIAAVCILQTVDNSAYIHKLQIPKSKINVSNESLWKPKITSLTFF